MSFINLYHHAWGILRETWALYIEMAPYLIVGFFVAGIISVAFPASKVIRHLSGRNFAAILKATIAGIPLPLCSCSVIPVATHLRREGASRSSTLAFLISTPSTGVDSIMATWSLMGWLFTVARTLADFFTALIAGSVMNLLDRQHNSNPQQDAPLSAQPLEKSCECDAACQEPTKSSGQPSAPRWKKALRYSFVTLVDDIGGWLVVGILLGGLITYLIPGDMVRQYLGNPLLAYPLMFLSGLPLYVCATGSIPIVAPLLLKGMSPGAALVFLIAGPATNMATITVVGRMLGKKALIVYLASITLCAIVFGLLLDVIWNLAGGELTLQVVHDGVLPGWLKITCAAFLLVCYLGTLIQKRQIFGREHVETKNNHPASNQAGSYQPGKSDS